MTTQCYVHAPLPMPGDDVINGFGQLAASLVSDVQGRWPGATGIAPVSGLRAGKVVVGPALTVRVRPGDNLVVHKALDLARPGEVLVVAAGGGTSRAILGGLMGQYAAARGLVALVVDGAVRDRTVLDQVAPPVFAAGLNHLGPYKDGPGELRGTVSIGGVVVADGDLIVADEDGVAVVPRSRLDAVLAEAAAKREAETAEAQAITDGTWDRRWIDERLTLVPVDADQTIGRGE